MLLKTIIKEEVPTVNKHLYHKGSLQKIKDRLQEHIDNKTCFVTIGHCSNPIESLIQSGNISGIVKDIQIEDGQGFVDVEPLDSPSGKLLETYSQTVPMVVDFRVQSVLEEDNKHVSMEDFNVENVLAVILDKQDEGNN